jgi:hypothetical protein
MGKQNLINNWSASIISLGGCYKAQKKALQLSGAPFFEKYRSRCLAPVLRRYAQLLVEIKDNKYGGLMETNVQRG